MGLAETVVLGLLAVLALAPCKTARLLVVGRLRVDVGQPVVPSAASVTVRPLDVEALPADAAFDV